MGVEFFTCHYCDETFPDCGYYFSCDCGHHYCDTKCGNGKTNDEDEKSCRICRYEDIPDHTLLDFLLPRFGLTRNAADQLYRETISNERK